MIRSWIALWELQAYCSLKRPAFSAQPQLADCTWCGASR